jgi:methyl-accepting chemotaxis protein
MSFLAAVRRHQGFSARKILQAKAGAVDALTAAVMFVDRDMVVRYVNAGTRDLLKKNEALFRSRWPGFEADKIVGACIDMFHRNPEHQRKLLADESKLPMRAEITVGDLKIALLVSAAHDARGRRIGSFLEWRDVTVERTNDGMLRAIDKVQAIIEFSVDGTIQTANANFLAAMGYSLDEIRGRHHSMFVEPAYRDSADYAAFWQKLGRGEYDAGQYKRIGKDGREVWIQASYNPILDAGGKAFKVVKYATDVTATVAATRAMQLTVTQTQAVVRAAEANDLSQRIPLDGKTGDLATLCSGVNGLLETMQSVIHHVSEAAHEVSTSSAEISTSTIDLSQRTEEQAASLEQTSAAMEQVAATTKKNAENALEASTTAEQARDLARQGGEIVGAAVEAVTRIEESSRKVSDIIGVIDEIARQTNLLALNAAVEAARAGESGRGFAVVASEVRNLAQRSSQAAKDIEGLITSSNEQVKVGAGLVNRAGASLAEIVQSISNVAGLVSDIAAASTEQATGIDQINVALTQMDEATQQNSALVEQNAATAKALQHQASSMSAEVSKFVIGDAARLPPRIAHEPPLTAVVGGRSRR